jgi:UDP-N-acetylglucosamine 1-carboxyvinyltransferase
MKKLVIQGGKKLIGNIDISGSKNSTLPILAATLLFDELVVLKNVPFVRDILTMCKLLENIGKKIIYFQKKNEIHLFPKKNKKLVAPYHLVKTMRAGVLVLGPLLSKYGKAQVSLPGGCAIGSRPVDLHIEMLKKMGASIEIQKGYIEAKAKKKLNSATIKFPSISVGATENLIMSAVMCKGTTIIKNIAIEPEIIDLISFLKKAGANIIFRSKRIVVIKGVSKLNSLSYSVISDRIEAGTYAVAALITNGKITLNKIDKKNMNNIFAILKNCGAQIKFGNNNSATITKKKNLHSIRIKTKPFPGFPTDMQAQIMSLMCLTKGTSFVQEDIFENRFLHVSELKRMGADISLKKKLAVIKGVNSLHGAEVMATDLRASVSLVLAALSTKEKTIINRIYHLERGYENLVQKLRKCGAIIKTINA